MMPTLPKSNQECSPEQMSQTLLFLFYVVHRLDAVLAFEVQTQASDPT
jgi:hypothetical protein